MSYFSVSRIKSKIVTKWTKVDFWGNRQNLDANVPRTFKLDIETLGLPELQGYEGDQQWQSFSIFFHSEEPFWARLILSDYYVTWCRPGRVIK